MQSDPIEDRHSAAHLLSNIIYQFDKLYKFYIKLTDKQDHPKFDHVGRIRIAGFDLSHKINPLFKQSSHQMTLSLG